MEAYYDRDTGYIVKEKMSNGQTFYMAFEDLEETEDTIYWNICLSVYSKRKHIEINENEVRITGKNPMESVVMALKAFKILEETILKRYPFHTNIIYCTWVDNRRRNAYYKFLSKKGYEYGRLEGKKVIMKVFPPQKDLSERWYYYN